MNKPFLILNLFMMISLYLLAQENEMQDKTTYSLEIDPATYAFNGYAIHLRVKPKKSDHVLLGFGTYAMDFPSALVDFNKKNKDNGWHVRLRQGLGVFGEYHFSEVNKGWFLGVQLAHQQYQLQKDFIDGEADYTTLLLMGLGGYTFRPFDFPLYFKTWGGIGYTDKLSGINNIHDAIYDISPVVMFGALHIGYTF